MQLFYEVFIPLVFGCPELKSSRVSNTGVILHFQINLIHEPDSADRWKNKPYSIEPTTVGRIATVFYEIIGFNVILNHISVLIKVESIYKVVRNYKYKMCTTIPRKPHGSPYQNPIHESSPRLF